MTPVIVPGPGGTAYLYSSDLDPEAVLGTFHPGVFALILQPEGSPAGLLHETHRLLRTGKYKDGILWVPPGSSCKTWDEAARFHMPKHGVCPKCGTPWGVQFDFFSADDDQPRPVCDCPKAPAARGTVLDLLATAERAAGVVRLGYDYVGLVREAGVLGPICKAVQGG